MNLRSVRKLGYHDRCMLAFVAVLVGLMVAMLLFVSDDDWEQLSLPTRALFGAAVWLAASRAFHHAFQARRDKQP